ncbi:BON domain-containing protein [Palleronia sp. KMU-117]|uniref:BON domain-containing protein n=1 Tax=Palleronia sp. KMU-117 TaxID=3434108 RepID=UPI003D71DBAA
MSDLSLKQDILDALDFDPSLEAAHIGVTVENGIVTLTGHVATFAERARAERVVARVKGVRGIAEEIEVRPHDSDLTADDEIAARAVNLLRWNTAVPEDRIQVRVSDGIVTLKGSVEWHYQREAAERALRSMTGLTGLINQLAVSPRASVGDVRERIEKALRRDAEIEAQGITVSISDGTVTLEGKVHSYAERRAVENAAWAAPGVKRVEDRLQVA